MERLSLFADEQLSSLDKGATVLESNKRTRTPICKLDFNNETKAFIQRKNVPMEINKVVKFTKFSPLINHKKYKDTPNLKVLQFKSSPMQLFNSFSSNSPFLLSKSNTISEHLIIPEEKTSQKKICCNCKKSHCLKLYCQCFINKSYCNGCNCLNCFNTKEYEELKNETVKATLQRNPMAFEPKISQVKEIVHLLKIIIGKGME